MGRIKVTPGMAAKGAASVIPDPSRKEAPPKEEHAADPWDADAFEAEQQRLAEAEPHMQVTDLDTDDAALGERVEIDAVPEASAPKRVRVPSSGSTVIPRAPAQQTTGGWGAMVETVYDLDPHPLYTRLYNELTMGEGATEYGAVLAACDRAEQNRIDACRLARFTKLEDERVEYEIKKRMEVLRTTARTELDQEKAEGKRSKAPTIQDIEDRVVANWPDQVESDRRRVAEMHGVLRAVEGLEDAWKSRCHTLRAIMERVAPPRR